MSDTAATTTLLDVFRDMYLPFFIKYKIPIAMYFAVLSVLYYIQPILLPKRFNEFLDVTTISSKGSNKLIRRQFFFLVVLIVMIGVIGYIKNCFDAFLPTRQFQFVRERLYERLIKELQTRVHTVRVGEFITLMNYLPREIRYLSENIINMLPVIMGSFFICLYTFSVNTKAGYLFLFGVIMNVFFFTYSDLARRLIHQSRTRTEHVISNNSRITEEVNQLDHIYANNQEYEKLMENSAREDNLQSAFETSVNTSNRLIFIVFFWNMFISISTFVLVYKEDHSYRKKEFRAYAFVASYFMMMMWNNLSRFTVFIMASESVMVFYRTFLQMLNDPVTENTKNNNPTDIFDPFSVNDPVIEFKDVSFRYSTSSPWVIQDFDWIVTPGSHWVVTGPSGRGKSTILKMVMRFFRPSQGNILFGHVPIEQYDVMALRKMICFVNQDTMLFEKSIYENIIFGNSDIDFGNVGQTLLRYNLIRNFQRTPNESVESVLQRPCGIDGRDLSKGQQKIVILARCLLRRTARIYLMDEPLASLDRATQENVVQWIVDTTSDKTVILTTHITDHSLFQRFQVKSLYDQK